MERNETRSAVFIIININTTISDISSQHTTTTNNITIDTRPSITTRTTPQYYPQNTSLTTLGRMSKMKHLHLCIPSTTTTTKIPSPSPSGLLLLSVIFLFETFSLSNKTPTFPHSLFNREYPSFHTYNTTT